MVTMYIYHLIELRPFGTSLWPLSVTLGPVFLQWKMRSNWLKFLRQRHVAVALQGPDQRRIIASQGGNVP